MMRRNTNTIEFLLVVLWLLSTFPSSIQSSATGSAVNHDNPPLQSTQPNLPNFVIILTDDLDWTLGGTHASTLHRTRSLIAEHGTTFSNWFVQTPVCCPSRAELLTGKFFHNLRVPRVDSQNGCMHIDVAPHANHSFYQRDYFAKYFARWNYTVGIFGKHLNNANPTDFLPEGVDEMLINGGGEYLDPTFTVATRHGRTPQAVTFNNCTESTGMPCYSTSIIGNASVAWIQRHLQNTLSSSSSDHPPPSQHPFLALISLKAPHILDGPGFPVAIPAPWYANVTLPEVSAPRFPNYNYSAIHHHWLVRSQAPMTGEEGERVDDLYVSRLKTLLSVDDLVEALFHSDIPLDNTYFLFTSDNGYRLGQFRMPMAKLHAYENDIRVPMLMRGPYIPPNTTSNLISTHVNLMPTLLGIVAMHDQMHKSKNGNQEMVDSTLDTMVVPDTMDGMNLASCILVHDDTMTTIATNSSSNSSCKSPSTLLIEYTSLGPVFRYNHTIDTYNHSFVALRILWNSQDDEEIDDSGRGGSFRANKRNNNNGNGNDNHTSTTTTTARMLDEGRQRQNRRNRNIMNIKYVEYRDSRQDWNGTNQEPPLEQELFDLDQDPYEMTNLAHQVSPLVLQALHYQLQQYLQCRGDSCRRRQQLQAPPKAILATF